MIINDYISENIIKEMRNEINKSSGNEIFFRGIPNKDGIVVEIEVIARGNENSVAALLSRMKKNEVIIHNHPSNILIPSSNDVEISSIYGDIGGASYIVNNNVDEIYEIVPLKKFVDIDIKEYYGNNGIIKNKINQFEVRKEQYQMSKLIENGLNNNTKLVVEAGTGTGKTIAYLIPSVLYGLENNIKVVISTNTINLQEQLINKDIPMLQKILSKEFSYILVKGRGNYLCKRKLYNINDTEIEKTEDKNIINNIKQWDSTTETGDRSELKEEISYNIWEKMNSESDLCAGVKCNYYSTCYFFKARKSINKSDVLIVNHHMFFADLSIRNEAGFNTEYAILPNYDIVVFDEAHNIEDTARNYFTYEVSRYEFGRLVGYIHNKRSTNLSNAGSLTRLLAFLNINLEPERYQKIDELKDEIISDLNQFYDNGIKILDKIATVFANDLTSSELKKRLDKEFFMYSKDKKNIDKLNKEFSQKYVTLIKTFNNFFKVIDNYDIEDDNSIIFDFKKYFERLKEYYKNFEFILDMEDKNYVYWISININKNNVRLYATPFDISEDLNKSLLSKIDRMVFTSATLSVDNKFDYFLNSIGIKDKKKIDTKMILSPFDYEKQMSVYIPSDVPDPNDINFIDNVLSFIKQLINKTEGKCFLLFTSYSTMNYLYNKIEPYFIKTKYTLIKQGDMPRNEMIEVFKREENPILFGTDSFWEGVDVQGKQLQSIIILKLPFKVPDDPVTEAIIEKIRDNKGNPFLEYQVPQAVIKFKQGIGRLIRSKEDKGIVTILDIRLVQKYYGKKFLKSLPKTNIIINNREEIIEQI